MSVISAGNTTTTTLTQTGDTTGNLVFTTGGSNTVALTLNNAQVATFANSPKVGSGTVLSSVTAPATNPATGTPSSSNYLRGDGTWASLQTAVAWAQFLGGTGSPLTINGSYNVSSITRTNVGKYVVNFTNNLTSNTYAVVASSAITQSQGIFAVPFYTAAGTISAPTVASFPLLYLGTNGAPFDVDYGNFAVFV